MAAYIDQHTEITNVLISGGDAFLINNRAIRRYLETFTAIDHLDLIRFGTRTPVVFPARIYDDPELLDIIREYSAKKQIYVVTHFNHPNEFTAESKKAIKALQAAGAVVRNQTVLLKGVNDHPETMAKLLKLLTSWGIVPIISSSAVRYPAWAPISRCRSGWVSDCGRSEISAERPGKRYPLRAQQYQG